MSDVQVHRWRKQRKDIDLDTPDEPAAAMEPLPWDRAMELKVKKAQADALISIAESLEKLVNENWAIAESLEKLASCVQSPDNSRPYLRTK